MVSLPLDALSQSASGSLNPTCAWHVLIQVDAMPEMDEAATVRCGIQCLQSVTDFRGNEIEVGVVSGAGRFRTLTEQEIEDHLTAINEMES